MINIRFFCCYHYEYKFRDFLNFKLQIRKCLFAPNLNVVSAFQKAARHWSCFCCSIRSTREISMPGGRSHCSCEFWRQHCPRTRRMTNHNWQIFWLADSRCKLSFLLCNSLFIHGTMTYIQENVNIWTEHWQAGAAQLPMWWAPCFIYKSEFIVYFFCVESFAFKS